MTRLLKKITVVLIVIVVGSIPYKNQFLRANVDFSERSKNTPSLQKIQPDGTPPEEQDLFLDIVASPSELGSHASFVQVTMPDTSTDDYLGAFVGIAASYPLFRGKIDSDENWQINFKSGILSQFNLDAPSDDLLNTDFVVGFPVTYRNDNFSLRTQLMHQSSHLGDELLLSGDAPDRINLSVEFLDMIMAYRVSKFRFYGGGTYLFSKTPDSLERSALKGGVEYRENLLQIIPGDFIGALDIERREETNWKNQISAKIGVDVAWTVGLQDVGMNVFLEGFDGPLPFGQFFTVDAEYYGIGVNFNS